MEVKTYQVGQIGTNCYFVGDEASKKGCMIDPGDEAENLIRLWGAFGYELSAILVTHGHFDHTTALAAVAAAFPNVPVYIRREDVCDGGRPEFWQCAHVSGMHYVKDGDTIAVGNLIFTVIETPGHTPGGAVCKTAGALFTGDTLFAGSCGRVDVPGSDWGPLGPSRRRLAALAGDTPGSPGPEWSTTLSRERAGNPYIRSARQLGNA